MHEDKPEGPDHHRPTDRPADQPTTLNRPEDPRPRHQRARTPRPARPNPPDMPAQVLSSLWVASSTHALACQGLKAVAMIVQVVRAEDTHESSLHGGPPTSVVGTGTGGCSPELANRHRTPKTGYGTTPVWCRGGRRNVEGCWGLTPEGGLY